MGGAIGALWGAMRRHELREMIWLALLRVQVWMPRLVGMLSSEMFWGCLVMDCLVT